MGEIGMLYSERLLEILFRVMRGEELSVKNMSITYGVSAKSISRDIGKIRDFFQTTEN